MAPKLILTGFMATGKSAIGRAAAARLGWRLVDSDAELVARAGKPIPAIFAEHGEAQFRALEREVIAALADDPALCPQCGEPRPAVISTGGGALVDERNYLALKRAGVIICLSARPEVIAARVRRSPHKRPKLTEGGRPLEADVLRRGMFETRLLGNGLRPHQIAQFAQLNLLSHVVEHEHPKGTAERPHPSILPYPHGVSYV